MHIYVRLVQVSIISLLCYSSFSSADDFHYNNILIGDRASGMDGAYTAISDDATGLFYNPAGIVYVTDKNFSASVNAYSSQKKTYENVIAGKPFERNSEALLANFFGVVKPIGNVTLGFSYAVPDANNEDQNFRITELPSGAFPGQTYEQTINLNKRESTINIGPSLAMAVDNELAFGLTLYVHKRDAQIIQNQFIARSGGSYVWQNSYFKASETGFRPVLGVSWSPMEKLSLGASLSTVYIVSATTTYQATCVDSAATNCSNGPGLLATTVTTYPDMRKYPVRAAIGAAYFASSNLLLSADVVHHTAVKNISPFENKIATWDAAIGSEYYLNKTWALRTGLFTNMANTTPIQIGVASAEEHINITGASLSMTRFSGGSSVTLGGTVTYGKGVAQIAGVDKIQDATTSGWTMFLSSSY